MGPCDGLSPQNLTPLAEVPCLKYCLSKTLGYGIVVGSAGVKLPQVLNILKAKSVVGLSPSSLLIEWIASVSSFSYYMALGYPFSTWGENFFLFFQNGIIAALYFRYTAGLGSARFAATALFSALLGAVLYTRSLPDFDLPPALCGLASFKSCRITCADIAGSLPVLLMLFGRLPQIAQNLRQGHTGSLSLITYALNVAGAGARVFTSMQELDDKFALTSAVSAFLQNGVLLAQILSLGSGAPAAASAQTRKARTKKAD
jgi:mannose-P-dolichol utilization defect protein 1